MLPKRRAWIRYPPVRERIGLEQIAELIVNLRRWRRIPGQHQHTGRQRQQCNKETCTCTMPSQSSQPPLHTPKAPAAKVRPNDRNNDRDQRHPLQYFYQPVRAEQYGISHNNSPRKNARNPPLNSILTAATPLRQDGFSIVTVAFRTLAECTSPFPYESLPQGCPLGKYPPFCGAYLATIRPHDCSRFAPLCRPCLLTIRSDRPAARTPGCGRQRMEPRVRSDPGRYSHRGFQD